MITVTKFMCAICKKQYDTEAEALKCEAQGFEPRFKIGDIVFAIAGFDWFDGDKRWISNPDVLKNKKHKRGNCGGACCTYQFYYVITHIDSEEGDGHRPRYHLFTNAMTGGYRSGFTFDIDHYTPVLVKNPPPFVVKDSKNLIGTRTAHLL